MATLTVTFTRGFPNVFTTQAGAIAVGQAARAESVEMPGTTTLQSTDGENVVELTADADCWVAIGESPNASANSAGERGAHFLKSGMPYHYWLDESGLKVHVEAAT